MLVQLLTRVFPSFIPLNEADDEEDQDEQSDGTHEANEPSLSGDVHLSACHSWPEEERALSIIWFLNSLFLRGKRKHRTSNEKGLLQVLYNVKLVRDGLD